MWPIVETAVNAIKRGWAKLTRTNLMQAIPEVTKEQSLASREMAESIELWLKLYREQAPWLAKKGAKSLGLPAIIATEVARQVTAEMQISCSGSEMAEFVDKMLDPVRKKARIVAEYACAGGGVIIKPCVGQEKIHPEFIHADMFYPVSYNSSMKITKCIFIYRHWEGKKVYSRLEKHDLQGTTCTITNVAYVSSISTELGKECELSEVAEWADIAPRTVVHNLEGPLYAYFSIPIGNTTDIDSPLGSSVYSRAVNLIQDADEQYGSLIWEYRAGEAAIDAPAYVFGIDEEGKPKLPEGKERLFRTNEMDMAATGGSELMKHWAPALRDANYIAGLNRILCQIEDACCLSRGTISDPALVAKTATEIKISKQRSYSLISDIQSSFQAALDDYVYAVKSLAHLYGMAAFGNVDTQYRWDDSIITDAEAERIRDQQEVAQGLMKKWEYRVKWYGETEAQAKKILAEKDGPTDDQILGFEEENPEEGE